MQIYVVEAGQTLAQIAQQNGTTAEQLRQDNGSVTQEPLVAGQTLVILRRQQTYTVKPGDSLWGIARQHGLTVRQLYTTNPFLYGSDQIQPGQVLTITYADTDRQPMAVSGYAYPNIDRPLLRQTAPDLTYLAPFTYGFTPDGDLIPLEDTALLEIAADYGTGSLLHLSTLTEGGNFSNVLASQVLQSDSARENLTRNLLTEIQTKGYDGLDVDFEFVFPAEAGLYAQFLRQLRDALNPAGYPVIAALVPKTSADQPGDFYQGHDYKAVGEAANFVLLMTYEWGYTYGPPMAVAPLPSVKRVLDYAVTEISPEKIYMGMPNYGYDWTLPYVRGESRARLIGNEEAVAMARRYGVAISYDETAQSPYFNYTDESGQEHVVWFEDARSILAKIQTAQSYGFYGLGYWNLMRPFLQNWQIVNQKIFVHLPEKI